jgi:hypothetical protein
MPLSRLAASITLLSLFMASMLARGMGSWAPLEMLVVGVACGAALRK